MRLRDVAEIGAGVTLGRELGTARSVEYPYLRVANVKDGYIDISEIKTVRILPSEFERFRLLKGDILLTEGGDFDKLGRGGVWDGSIPNCLHQNHIFRIRLRNGFIPEFFAAYMASTAGRAYFLSCSKQTTNLASINKSQLSSMPVFVPSIVVQRRVAAILTAADAAISATEALINKILATQSALSVGLLADLDPSNTVGEVLEGTPKNGLYKPASDYKTDGTRIVRIDSIQSGSIRSWDSLQRVGLNLAEERYFALRNGDILINRVNSIDYVGKSAVVRDLAGPAVFESNVMRCRVRKGQVRPAYVGLWLSTSQAMAHFRSCAKSAISQASINQTDVRSCPIAIPDLSEQDAIVARFEAMHREMEAHQNEVSKLRLMKQGLMEDLLTGRVRVSEL